MLMTNKLPCAASTQAQVQEDFTYGVSLELARMRAAEKACKGGLTGQAGEMHNGRNLHMWLLVGK